MTDVTRFFTLLSPTMALLIYFVIKGFIGVGDIVLSVVFVVVGFITFGIQWRHRLWKPQETEANERIRRLLLTVYKTMTVLVIVTPLLSLGTAYLLNEQAPRYVDKSVMGMIRQPPDAVPVETLVLKEPLNKGNESYVAVFQDTVEHISPTHPVLKEVFGNIDLWIRTPTAWFSLVVVIILLVGLKVGELFAEMNMNRSVNDTIGTGATAQAKKQFSGH
jgi:hypothetical protein